ncbi:MAG: prolipoprotein diacylglyceryl transferase [Phycisphaerae bacterium]|nr:prolipoprotein diacylglyceryl transferase [Phycisphaerae bacterium]
MHPELFTIPFLDVSVKSYGTLMVIGFLLAVLLMRRMMKKADQNPELITNAALYALLTGIVASKLFYIIQHYDPAVSIFSMIFSGAGFVLLGGVIGAVGFLLIYLYVQKLPMRIYFDVLAVGLMLGLAFGRLGCLMNGCCYGRPADVPWAIRFPYASLPYYGQAYPDMARSREKPLLDLPTDYFGWKDRQGGWIPASDANKFEAALKPKELLTDAQKQAVTQGPYRCLPVHPTQIYSSLNAFLLSAIFYFLWCQIGLKKPGMILGLTLIAYGIARFGLESLRDDNPFEYAWWMLYKGGTISQNISLYLILLGAILLAVTAKIKPPIPKKGSRKGHPAAEKNS